MFSTNMMDPHDPQHEDEGPNSLLLNDISDEKRTEMSGKPLRRLYVFCLLFAGAIGIIFIIRSWTKRSTPWVDCGASPAEARAAKCHFEAMQRAWVPDACYFSEPGDEYNPFGEREWFLDKNLTQKIDGKELEKLKSGDITTAYYDGSSFHDEHCLYSWRKLAIAVERQLPLIDTKTADLHHSTHCSIHIAQKIVNNTFDDSLFVGISPLKYFGCVELPWR